MQLTTQVLEGGQIIILGIDKYNKEVLRFYVDHEQEAEGARPLFDTETEIDKEESAPSVDFTASQKDSRAFVSAYGGSSPPMSKEEYS